jgi:hypothetical protein
MRLEHILGQLMLNVSGQDKNHSSYASFGHEADSTFD